VVACFGDPGVAALRELAPLPVYVLAEESLRNAASKYELFAIVTAGPAWESMLAELIYQLGLEKNHVGTYAIDASGLTAAQEPERFRALMQRAIEKAEYDGAKAIVLGGAALAGSVHLYHSKVPLVDCVESAFASIANACFYPESRSSLYLPPPSIESLGLAPELAALLRQQLINSER
jgi:Asp/Glu/hydantoin racemase